MEPAAPCVFDRAFALTQGQPWLVNALARQLTQVLVRDRAEPISAANVDEAAEILIRRQDTHLDSLIERLREPRVRAIIEPMLAGETLGETLAIEIKGWRPGRPDPQAAGLVQLDGYLAGLGLDSGWLVIFDRRPGLPPVEERLTASEDTSPAGNRVTVIRA